MSTNAVVVPIVPSRAPGGTRVGSGAIRSHRQPTDSRLPIGILIRVVLVAGVALMLTPVVTQELWTAQLVLPVLLAGALPLYLVVSLVLPGHTPDPRPPTPPIPPRNPEPHPVDPRAPRGFLAWLLAALSTRGEL